MHATSSDKLNTNPQEHFKTVGCAQSYLRTQTDKVTGDVLIGIATARTREQLYASPDTALDIEQSECLAELLSRHLCGEPVAYLRKSAEFYSLPFEVSPATLIPRPATETVVDAVLECAEGYSLPLILDLGTGCGAIAVTTGVCLKRKGVESEIYATDISQEALAVAENNARHHNVDINFVQSNWFETLNDAARFDIIVSNPPYIKDGDPELEVNVRKYEPELALIAGADGYAHLKHIIQTAPAYLNAGGKLILECGAGQTHRVVDILREHAYTEIEQVRDIEGHLRVAVATKP